ncbi:MAG: DUF3592 domain-containing protein [Planctomycetales bacterium]|nr:DUF3592 domain-containing protein [Planctomycetales bacterium]
MVKKTEKVVPRRAVGCLTVFALPFLLVGIGAAGFALWSVVDWIGVQRWREVSATVLEVHLDEHQDDDQVTFRARARYRYEYGGAQFTGSRVSLDRSADNLGDYQERVATELMQAQQQGRSVRCFINPAAPGESILYRDLRVGKLGFLLLFAVVFGGSGAGLLWIAVKASRWQMEVNQRSAAHPHEPWLWKEEWASGQIPSQNHASVFVAWFFGIFWNAIAAPLLFVLPREIQDGNRLATIGLIFPLVGLLILSWAIIETLRWFKYGESTVQLATIPGVIGGPLSGVVRTSAKLPSASSVGLTLTCLRSERTETRKGSHQQDRVLWQTEQTLAHDLATRDADSAVIPFHFAIPFDAVSSSTEKDLERVTWRLEIKAETPGVDYYACFDVPVFVTIDSSPEYEHDDTVMNPYLEHVDIDRLYARARVLREETPRGLVIEFPLLRSWGLALSITAFIVLWTGFIALMVHLGAPFIFPVVFAAFDLLLIVVAFEFWLWTSHITIDKSGLTARVGLVGLARERHFARDQIRAITCPSETQSGHKLFYDIKLEPTEGPALSLGKNIGNLPTAEAMIEDMKARLGIADAAPELVETA